MEQTHILKSSPDNRISVREFAKGAKSVANLQTISVIIDVFRASNTILTMVEAGGKVRPVMTIDEALKYEDYIKVGEKDGKKYELFDYDNSPVSILDNKEKFNGRNVVIRTTNGTRGLISALGSKEILIGTFRNLTVTSNYCKRKYDEGFDICFIAMGSKDKSRIEDITCAKMFYYKLIEMIGIKTSMDNNGNPLEKDWITPIKEERFRTKSKIRDYEYALALDQSDYVLLYNQSNKFIQKLGKT